MILWSWILIILPLYCKCIIRLLLGHGSYYFDWTLPENVPNYCNICMTQLLFMHYVFNVHSVIFYVALTDMAVILDANSQILKAQQTQEYNLIQWDHWNSFSLFTTTLWFDWEFSYSFPVHSLTEIVLFAFKHTFRKVLNRPQDLF